MKKKKLLKIISLLIVFAAIFFAGYFTNKYAGKIKFKKISLVTQKQDKYISFLFEVYDTIQTNYWDKITDEQLVNIYVLGTEKLVNKKQDIQTKTRKNLELLLQKNLKDIKDENKKKEFTANLADIVLANLAPFGRSRLYSQKQEITLKNTVENKNPEINQYQVLDISKDASSEQIKKAFEDKSSELSKESSPEAKLKLAQVSKAFEILSDKDNKKVYDQSGVEPTMEWKLLTPDIFYLKISKFSPTTVEELVRTTQKVDTNPGPSILILDLRDNIGGAIDGLPYFLGPFIGNDQYAYQFFHQGQRQDFKTQIGWLPSLVRYKKVVVLINQNSQSTAEVMASTIKRYNVGILVGTKTKGWGTVEKIFPINNQIDENTKYSLFLVHSLTLRDDNQPIEGKGVEPVVNMNDKNWETEFNKYFQYPTLNKAIKQIYTQNI